MVRSFLVAVALLAGARAAAQTQQPPAYPPPAYPPQQQPQQPPPPPAAQPAPPAPPATAGSEGQSSTAQPGSPGASSQQVVVNPPSSQQPSTATPPPSSTTVVNPPGTTYREDTYVEQQIRTNPIATVATDAAWGGLAGLVIGFGVTLVNQFDHWDRDLMVGAGAGVLVGAAVGVAQAAYDASQSDRRRRVAYGDGMNRTDRDPVITAPTVGFAFRF